MSELKVFDIVVSEEYYCEGIVKYRRAVYDKSEADKVISEKDEEIAELKDKLQAANEQIENLINSASSIMLFQDRVNDNNCAELRHQKYKRCLDKAEMCQAKYDEEDARVNGRGASWDYISKEMKYWERWHWRWLELAEKFKPNKEA